MSTPETTIDDSAATDTSEEKTEAQLRDEILNARSSGSTSQDSEPEDASVPVDEIAKEPPEEGDEPDQGDDKAISEDPQDADDKPDGQRPEDDKAKRLAGIVSARDKQINKYSQRIRELEERIAKADKVEPVDISSLDELEETYPDLMGGVAKTIRDLKGQVDALTSRSSDVSELTAERSREIYEAEEDALTAKMPDWKETVTGNREAFWSWVEDQPKADRDLAYSSQDKIIDSAGLHSVIERFKAHLTGEVQTEPGSSEPESQRTNKRRLDGARTVPSKGSQAASTQPRPGETDPVALRNKILADRARKR